MKKVFSIINIIVLLILAVLLSTYLLFYNTAQVSGPSMTPTFQNGDFILIQKSIKHIKNFDKVVVHSDILDKELCKRVIGLPGDTVIISNGVLRINNKVIKEDYLLDQKWDDGTALNMKIADGEIFVMGDNRNDSMDSRNLGTMKLSDVDGIIIYDFTKELGITKAKAKYALFILWVIVVIDFVISNIRNVKEGRSNKSSNE